MELPSGTSSGSTAEDCPLCSAERLTSWHFEDDECWVADCLVCATPMIVWRSHGLPLPEVEDRLLQRLAAVAAGRYGQAGFWIDSLRRRIPDHWHAHARPEGGFFDPSAGPTPWRSTGGSVA